MLNESAPQLSNAVIQLAILAVVGVCGIVTAVIGWFIRRDIKLAEAARAEQGLKYAALEERFNDHVRRTGFELNDVKYRVGIMATEIRPTIPEVTVPEWPSR